MTEKMVFDNEWNNESEEFQLAFDIPVASRQTNGHSAKQTTTVQIII